MKAPANLCPQVFFFKFRVFLYLRAIVNIEFAIVSLESGIAEFTDNSINMLKYIPPLIEVDRMQEGLLLCVSVDESGLTENVTFIDWS